MNNSSVIYKYGEKSFPNGYNPIVVLFCYRQIAIKIASLLKNINSITPNKITILGLIIFMVSTLLISYSTGTYKIIGIVLGPIWIFIDYLDGSLARLRGITSSLGKKLDALQDHFAFFLIPIGIYISLENTNSINIYFIILAFISFNQYLYAVGVREIFDDGQLPSLNGTAYDNMNYLQRKFLHRTKINIGFHTFLQGDTLFFIYWVTSFYNISQVSLVHFLLWSIIRNIILFKKYWLKMKDQ